MFCRSQFWRSLSATPPTPAVNAPHEIRSAFQLLRLVLHSIELKVKSRHAREFLRKRVISQWREHRGETDPQKQRLLMERASTVMTVLHMKGKAPVVNSPVEYSFDRPTRTTVTRAAP